MIPGTPQQRAPRKTLPSSPGLEKRHPACEDREKGWGDAEGDLKVGRTNLPPEHPALRGWGVKAEGPPYAGCSASQRRALFPG